MYVLLTNVCGFCRVGGLVALLHRTVKFPESIRSPSEATKNQQDLAHNSSNSNSGRVSTASFHIFPIYHAGYHPVRQWHIS